MLEGIDYESETCEIQPELENGEMAPVAVVNNPFRQFLENLGAMLSGLTVQAIVKGALKKLLLLNCCAQN